MVIIQSKIIPHIRRILMSNDFQQKPKVETRIEFYDSEQRRPIAKLDFSKSKQNNESQKQSESDNNSSQGKR